MIHHDLKIDVTRYTLGQREESQHYERKWQEQKLTPERVMIGSNSNGISFDLQDLLGALEIAERYDS